MISFYHKMRSDFCLIDNRKGLIKQLTVTILDYFIIPAPKKQEIAVEIMVHMQIIVTRRKIISSCFMTMKVK